MNQSTLLNLSVLVLFLPLLGFVITLLLGKKFKAIYLFEILILISAFAISSVIAFTKLNYFTDINLVEEFEWINLNNMPIIGNVPIVLGIMLDNISVLMLFVVSLISMLVHVFSIAYMKGDLRYNRYFAYLGIFTFSMNGIVLTHNILMMYIFWELVGLSYYLLIGFW